MRRSLLAIVLCRVALGCSWDYQIWIPRDPSADPLFRFVKGDDAGYIDQTGKVVIPPSLPFYGNHGGEFHSGLQEIGVSDGVYVDTTGKTVIDKHFYRGWEFSDGLAVAMRKDGEKWGYIDRSGEFVISPRFDHKPDSYVWSFENGFAKIKVAGKYGYIDHSGEFVIPPRFLDGESFHEGMAQVIAEGPCHYWSDGPCGSPVVLPRGTSPTGIPACKFTFTDAAGRLLKQRFDRAGDFSEDLAAVRIGTLWGYIDKTGEIVVQPRFDGAEPFSEGAKPFAEGLAAVTEKGLVGFIDHNGIYVIRPQFSAAEGFSNRLALVRGTDKRYSYIGKDGRQAFPDQFDIASSFFKGLAHVKLDDGSFAYINTKGRRVFAYRP